MHAWGCKSLIRDMLEVNLYERNAAGRAFCDQLGFEEIDRLDRDTEGRPYALLRLLKRS